MAIICSLLLFGGALYLYTFLPSQYKNRLYAKLKVAKEDDSQLVKNAINESTAILLQSIHEAKNSLGQIQSSLNNEDRNVVSTRIDNIEKLINETSYNINQRFETVEFYLKELKDKETNTIQLTDHPFEKEGFCNGYFGFPISKTYFKFQKQSTEDCFFSAIINGEIGSYDLLSLEKVKYEDGLENVIKFVGNLRKSEAKDYKVVEKGEVTKLDSDNMWKISRPLIVELY